MLFPAQPIARIAAGMETSNHHYLLIPQPVEQAIGKPPDQGAARFPMNHGILQWLVELKESN